MQHIDRLAAGSGVGQVVWSANKPHAATLGPEQPSADRQLCIGGRPPQTAAAFR